MKTILNKIIWVILLGFISSVSFSESDEIKSPLFKKTLEMSKKNMIQHIDIKKVVGDNANMSESGKGGKKIMDTYAFPCPTYYICYTNESECTAMFVCDTYSQCTPTSNSSCYTYAESCYTLIYSCYPSSPDNLSYPEYDEDGVFDITWYLSADYECFLERYSFKTKIWTQICSTFGRSYTEHVEAGLYEYRIRCQNEWQYSSYYQPQIYCFVNTPEKVVYDDWTTTTTWNCWSGIDPSPKPDICEFSSNGILCKWSSNPLPAPGFFQILKSNPDQPGLDNFIPYYENTIYIVKIRMKASADINNPQIRIRTQSADNVWTACGYFAGDGAFANQGGAPNTTSSDYYFVYQPIGSDAPAFLAVDIFNGNSFTGQVNIDDIEIFTTPIPYKIYWECNSNNFSSWTSIGSNATIGTDKVIIYDTDSYVLTGGYISLANQIAPNNIYRIDYYLKKNSSTLYCDPLRMRVADSYNGSYISTFTFNDKLAQKDNITSSPKYYYLYHWAANKRNTVLNSDLTVCLDAIEVYPNQGAETVLSDITIDRILTPSTF